MIALEVWQADVTRLDVNAITDAANTPLKHGGGVAAAISRAGGPTRAPLHRTCAYCEEIRG
jgi:O-acetyl-ADP-ribose deacetylase (regulator of RNase III)